jgi:uncharacterized membrane protein YtjA (UPF0391 family)
LSRGGRQTFTRAADLPARSPTLTLRQARMSRAKDGASALCEGEKRMLHYAVVFLVIALIAALFGFGGIAAGAVEIAKVLFFVFIVMAVVTFIANFLRRR